MVFASVVASVEVYGPELLRYPCPGGAGVSLGAVLRALIGARLHVGRSPVQVLLFRLVGFAVVLRSANAEVMRLIGHSAVSWLCCAESHRRATIGGHKQGMIVSFGSLSI
jgi:hypothetical protein